MKLSVVTHYPQHDGTHMLNWIKASAAADVYRNHQLWDDPETADAILFFEGHAGIDPLRLGILSNRLYRKHKHKCFLYQDGDYAFPFMPGIYPSLLKEDHKPGWCEGAPYFARQAVNAAVTAAIDLQPPRKWTASFIGANNCEVRQRILSWNHSQIFTKDTTGLHAWQMSERDRQDYERVYANVCAESHSILAPRGIGPSTYRLYEAMEIGRCPVILSDQWVAPKKIDWNAFAIVWPESMARDPQDVVDALAKIDVIQMGLAARSCFQDHLSDGRAWNYIASTIEELTADRKQGTTKSPLRAALQSKHRRVVLGSMRRSLRNSRRLFS